MEKLKKSKVVNLLDVKEQEKLRILPYGTVNGGETLTAEVTKSKTLGEPLCLHPPSS